MGKPNSFQKDKATAKPKKRDNPKLGILRLEAAKTPEDLVRPASYDYEMITETVAGLTLEVAQSGTLTDAARKGLKDAVKALEQKGCSCITAESSIMMNFQAEANAFAKVPAFMSSLLLCPMIGAAFGKTDKIIVL